MQGCRWHPRVPGIWIQAAAELGLSYLPLWKSWSCTNWTLGLSLLGGEQIAHFMTDSTLHWKNQVLTKFQVQSAWAVTDFSCLIALFTWLEPCCISCISNHLICNDPALPWTFCVQPDKICLLFKRDFSFLVIQEKKAINNSILPICIELCLLDVLVFSVFASNCCWAALAAVPPGICCLVQ